MERCRNCFRDKEVSVCYDCFWTKVCQAMHSREEDTIAERINWLISDTLDKSLEPLIKRISSIEAILKIKINKRRKGSDFIEKPNTMENQK